ncbi:hypothetical protein KUTeg_023156 [Tegillarca granosa]|uniref:Uncharacterized protein n=1 Tax=Tegillarca granosa TaxID=220873 RepID=A0ABQ9E5S9_TEGGR|nr:hypothetical protein KUTeg_023156 [Tegillarca granosa]
MFVKDMKTKYTNDLQYLKDDQIEVLYSQLLTAHITWGHGVDNHHASGTDTTNRITGTTTVPETTTYNDLNITTSHDANGRRKRAASVADDHNTGSDGNSSHSSNHTDGHHDDHHAHGHTIEEDIAHAFHKASITILAILAAETMFKIFCHGKHFFENKLETALIH